MTGPAPAPAAQAEVVSFLASADAFGTAPNRRIDTHAAIIFLAGDRAWKMKRAVQFPYLDFSTSERRRAALEAELALNRRTAPQLYRAVHSVNRSGEGQLKIDGPGEAVDWLLEMARFPDESLLSVVAERGALDDTMTIRLADRIAGFHAEASIAGAAEGLAPVRAIIDGNRASMLRYPAILSPDAVAQLHGRTREHAVQLSRLLDQRAAAGRVRHCHGDLHLANIVLLDGEPILFDCLEFDPALATVDVLYDLSFLLMDLWKIGMRHQANMLFNRYLDVSPEDEAGSRLVPLFMAMRAAIRAHVHAARAETGQDEAAGQARAYLALADQLLAPADTCLVAVGGLSGTGKSTVARALGGAIGRAPGARILRTDVLRKQLAGKHPEQRLPPRSYSKEASLKVYRRLGDLAGTYLQSGHSVIADAVFAAREERDAIAATARAAGADFAGLWLDAPVDLRENRISRRTTDASDADARVARQQQPVTPDQLPGWQRVEAGLGVEECVTGARAILGLP
jgi:aminoglycoside phosphotransferase family enzyme/predicted kinase